MPVSGGWSDGRRPDDAEFISILVPCLTLVAPVGMDVAAQDAWLEAATKALCEVPAELLRRGAAAAMRTADHHSKIVPAILAEVERLLATDRAVARVWQGADNSANALPAPGAERPNKSELDCICRQYGVGRYAKTQTRDPHMPAVVAAVGDPERPTRIPTRQDYIRLFGVDPDTAAGGDGQA